MYEVIGEIHYSCLHMVGNYLKNVKNEKCHQTKVILLIYLTKYTKALPKQGIVSEAKGQQKGIFNIM